MNISLAIMQLFPDAEPNENFLVMDEGEGQFLAKWNMCDLRPTEEELQAAWEEYLAKPKELTEIEQLKVENQELKKDIMELSERMKDIGI